jgi:hypothetical protein
MDMEFQVGQSVTFGFDVGGGYIPPEPSHSDMVFTNHPVAIAKTYGHFQEPIVTPCGIATKEE